MRQRNGFMMLAVLVITFAVVTLLAALMNMSLLSKKAMILDQQRMTVRYLAEAGLAHGHSYLQDLAWSSDGSQPGAGQLKKWLIVSADKGGSSGSVHLLGAGGYKIVKIAGQPALYSIGFIGSDPMDATYRLVIKEEAGKRFIL